MAKSAYCKPFENYPLPLRWPFPMNVRWPSVMMSAFFQAVRAALVKSTVDGERDAEDIDQAIRQILSRAVAASDQVIDIFAAAGLKKPEISILSEEFLADSQRYAAEETLPLNCFANCSMTNSNQG